jgi:DNA topoisomerase-1
MERKSRRGKTFFGCSGFPDCTFALWDKPIAQKCPQCDANFIVEKTTKKEGTFLKCMTKGCGFKG